MKHILIPALILCAAATCSAQFRGMEPRNPSVQDAVVKPSSGLLFGFFDPDRFRMNQSVSMSYTNIGGQGVGLSMYTNSMSYRISDPLLVRADVSLVYSPFSTLGSSFQKEIGGIYLNRAQVDYQPSKTFRISLQYRNLPYGAYPYGYSRGIMGGWGMFTDDGY